MNVDFVVHLFFFNDTATTEIYTLSLHDALPIAQTAPLHCCAGLSGGTGCPCHLKEPTSQAPAPTPRTRSASTRPAEDNRADRKSTTSELQSRQYLVCRLLLEKKKKADRSSLEHH